MARTHYDNLQVTRSASDRVIKAAYKSLAHEWHPDRNSDRRDEAERNMKIINEAYRVLSDPDRRQQHDRWIQSSDDEQRDRRYDTNSDREPNREGESYRDREPYRESRQDGTSEGAKENRERHDRYSQGRRDSYGAERSHSEGARREGPGADTRDQNKVTVSPYASHWKRITALVIDVLISLPLGFFIGVFYVSFANTGDMTQQQLDSNLNGIGYLVWWFYFALMESSKFQATPGKLLMKLQVTNMAGGRIGFWHASGRHWGKLISTLLLFIGFIMIFFTKKRQGLHDQLAGCVVINRIETNGGDEPLYRERGGKEKNAPDDGDTASQNRYQHYGMHDYHDSHRSSGAQEHRRSEGRATYAQNHSNRNQTSTASKSSPVKYWVWVLIIILMLAWFGFKGLNQDLPKTVAINTNDNVTTADTVDRGSIPSNKDFMYQLGDTLGVIGETLFTITDADSARAALPKLESARSVLDNLAGMVSLVDESTRFAVASGINAGMGALGPIVEKLQGDAGIWSVIGPTVSSMIATLKNLSDG